MKGKEGDRVDMANCKRKPLGTLGRNLPTVTKSQLPLAVFLSPKALPHEQALDTIPVPSCPSLPPPRGVVSIGESCNLALPCHEPLPSPGSTVP